MDYEKITKMESILNRQVGMVETLDQMLYQFEKSQEEYQELRDYYLSEEYLADVEESNNSEMPEGLAHGVFSEDSVYDLISENYHLAIRMLELATKIIKNH